MKIEILSWPKYNPRKDLKSMPWFKLQSDIGYSEDLFDLTPDQKWLWVFILSTCARKMTGTIDVNLKYFEHNSGVRKEIIEETLQVYESVGLVRILYANDTDTFDSVPKRREEKRREEENTQDKRVDVLESPDNLFHQVVKLWNEMLGNDLGKIYSMPNGMDINNFKITQGYLPDIDSWEVLFNKCKNTKLTGSDKDFKCTWFGLGWLLKSDNTANVTNGQWPKSNEKQEDSEYSEEDINKILKD